MGVLDWQLDEGTGDVAPRAEGPVDRTGFFENIGAGYRAAIAGPGSTRNRQNAAEARYYDTIIQALAAEGEMGEDKIAVRPGGIGYRGPKDIPVNQFGVGFVGKRRPFKNPFTDAPSLSQGDNPLSRFYLSGNRIELEAIWEAVNRVRQRKPDFLKDFADETAVRARADKDRQARFAQTQQITSRAGTLGRIGEFVGNIAGSIVAGDPENFAGIGVGTTAGKTVARTIIKRSLTEGAINAAAGVVGLPGQDADREHLGMEEMTGKEAGRSLLEQFAIGAVFGTAAEVAPIVGRKAKEAGGKAVEAVASVPAVRDAVAAASLRAGTVKDRELLTEWKRLRNPYAVGDTATPDEKAAAHVAEHDIEVREASPLDPKAEGDNNDRLSAIATSLGVTLKAPELPSPAPVQAPTVREQGAPRVASYEEAVHRAEGTGKNPKSSASGHFQFTKGTWLEYAPRVADTAGMSERQVLALRNDRSVAEKAERLFRADNAKYLRERGLEDSPGNLSLAHFLGRHDAAKVLKAAPDTPVEQLVDAASIRANKSVLAGKSASEVIAWAHSRIGAAVDGPVARPDAVPEFDPLDEIEYAEVRPYGTAEFRPDEVEVNAGLMQYKSDGDEFGVTDKLRNVTAWNPLISSEILVWETNDGRRIVVDGHQRTGLAKRLSAEDDSIRLPAVVIREADGITAQHARVLGALRNIALGMGRVEEAARVLQDAPNGGLLPELSPIASDILDLAEMSHEEFGAIVNGEIPPRRYTYRREISPELMEAQKAYIAITDQRISQTELQRLSWALRDGMTPEQAASTVHEFFSRPIDWEAERKAFNEELARRAANAAETRELQPATAGMGSDGGDGAAPGASRGSDALEAPDAELPDSLEPSLFDQAVTTAEKAEAFSDPVSTEATAQTALIEHDLLMDATDPEAPSLFDTPETGFRLDEEGDARPIADIMHEAEADERAAQAAQACLQPPKGDA